MNPFQHSDVAASIYKVFDQVSEDWLIHVEQDDLGELACMLAEMLAETYNLDPGPAPDRIELYLDDPNANLVLFGIPPRHNKPSGKVVKFSRTKRKRKGGNKGG